MSWLPHIPIRGEHVAEQTTQNFEALAGRVLVGVGSPEGVVGAPVGTLYLRSDGGEASTLYVKESAATSTDPTGWVAK